jgi:uncharacterized membrane protein
VVAPGPLVARPLDAWPDADAPPVPAFPLEPAPDAAPPEPPLPVLSLLQPRTNTATARARCVRMVAFYASRSDAGQLLGYARRAMKKGRVEAFSDGVFAVIITIMVLEIKVPQGADLAALAPVAPVFGGYCLSFVYIGIYWNNHHHLLHATERIEGKILWANLHLLFWLSLVPVVTTWVGENHTAAWPTAIYGVLLLGAGIAYLILQTALVRVNGRDSKIAQAMRRDVKGPLSALLYMAAIGLAFVRPWLSDLIYAGVAAIWLIPDRRIERVLGD